MPRPRPGEPERSPAIRAGLLKRETECKKGIEIKRMKCLASDEYRDKVLFKCGT